MAKVGEEDDDTLWRGDWLSVRAMRIARGMPAKEWFDTLSAKETGTALAAFATMETTLRAARPPAGRAEFIAQSKTGLWELRVTKPGSSAPHLRALYLRRARTLWLAFGFTKQKNKLTSREIDAGDNVAAEWLNNAGLEH